MMNNKKRAVVGKVRAVVPPVAARFKKPSLKAKTEAALSTVPKITNETVAEHRENVLKGARKYKYPLQHSRRKIVIVSSTLLFLAIFAFFTFTVASLYKRHSQSTLMYRVTQIIPFPIAKAGDDLVAYEDYLFEMRRYTHYYETQQKVDFDSESGQLQLKHYRPRAMDKIVDAAYVKQLAEQNHVSVGGTEVDEAIDTLRIQNQLGSGQQGLSDIMKKFFGWSMNDLRREIRNQLLVAKVVQKLDTEAQQKARTVEQQAREGSDFAALAKQYSDDVTTKESGGQFPNTAIVVGSQDVAIEVVRTLQTMKPGEVSSVVATPTSLEVVKLLAVENGKFKAAHIQINLKDIKTFIAPLKKEHSPKVYIEI